MSVWSFLAGLWVGAVIGGLTVAFLRGARGPVERSERDSPTVTSEPPRSDQDTPPPPPLRSIR